MGVRFPFGASNSIVNGMVITTTDTIIVTSPLVIPPVDGAMLLVLVYLVFNPSTTATSFDYNIRRGTSITSPQINAVTGDMGFTPTNRNVKMAMGIDSPGSIGPVQYSLSLHANGATGNTTIADAVIAVLSL